MKFRVILLGVFLLNVLVFSQFTIKGKVKGAENQVAFIRFYDGAKASVLNRVVLDDKGAFMATMPKEYEGLMEIEYQNRILQNFLVNNKDVEFTAEIIGGTVKGVKYINGDLQKAYLNYLDYSKLKSVETDVFPYLTTIYNPSDKFYSEIEAEKKRIAGIYSGMNLDKYPILKYYDGLNSFVQKMAKEQDINIVSEQTLNRIVNDSEYIETTGLFGNLIYNYVQASANGARDNQQLLSKVSNAVDVLLTKTDIETFRGQKVLTNLLELLPKEQFGSIHDKYLAKCKELTCSKTEGILDLLASEQVKEGGLAPDFTFKKQNGASSLYEIGPKKKLLVFWASWCPACRNEMPFVKEFYNNFKEENGEIIAISLDFDENDFNEATKDFEWINHTDLLKWDSKVASLYGIKSTPTLILLDENNKIEKITSRLADLLE